MVPKLKMISIMALTCLALVLYSFTPAGALTRVTDTDGLLVITDDYLVDAKTDILSIKTFKAIAVSADTLEHDRELCKAVRNAFENYGARVYLFGDLTINDYKRLIGAERFGADASIFDEKGITKETAFVFLSPEQESNDVFNIISFAKSDERKHMLAKVSDHNKTSADLTAEYIRIIADDFDLNESIKSITIVKSGFNYRSYLTSSVYANMDFILYRDFSELDPDYDYFAIKTNICTYGYSTSRIEAEHRLPFPSDELIDYGPGDISKADSVSVNLSLCGSSSISYTFSVDGKPSIDASYYAVDDYCTWIINRYWFLGELVNELFSLGSSWASTGTYAGTNVKFRALFNYGIDSFYSPWTTIEIRYNY